ncbi:MAG: DUF1778 domain-containing protein [Clostridia bacterium]|nr:DUF1778 domain-containing protein [Clostridia bacterium]
MNNTPKNKTQRLEIRITPENKKKIERYASKCGLSTSEYVTKRALGFAPRAVLPDAFFTFYAKLYEICNMDMTPETEAKLLTLIDEIHSEILSPKKEVNDLLLPQDFGP